MKTKFWFFRNEAFGAKVYTGKADAVLMVFDSRIILIRDQASKTEGTLQIGDKKICAGVLTVVKPIALIRKRNVQR